MPFANGLIDSEISPLLLTPQISHHRQASPAAIDLLHNDFQPLMHIRIN